MVNWNATSAQAGSEQAGGTTWVDGDPLYVGSGDYHAAWRYANVTVPNAATINDATHTIDVSNDPGGLAGIDYFANAVDDAPVIVTAGRPSTMTLTSTPVPLPTSPGAGAEATVITSIVQEIVNRAGWASGNDMVIVLFEDGTDTASYLTINGALTAASLDINYTVGGGGGVAPIAVHHMNQMRG